MLNYVNVSIGGDIGPSRDSDFCGEASDLVANIRPEGEAVRGGRVATIYGCTETHLEKCTNTV